MQSEQTVCGKRRGLAALSEEIKEKKETTHSSEKPEDAWFCVGGARWERIGSIQRQVSGQLVGALASQRLGVPFGIVDLSLAPTPAIGDSVARILEEVGLEVCGGCGTTAILAMLNDAVKKGGVMASNHVGGLSGAFIPVSEDDGMINAANCGSLTLEKLEAMTAVCSVGIDMVVIPGDTSAEVISGLIADEAAIGMVNSKTTAVRVIPAIGHKAGDVLDFGGLLGHAPIMPISRYSPAVMIHRGGRIPAPMQALKN